MGCAVGQAGHDVGQERLTHAPPGQRDRPRRARRCGAAAPHSPSTVTARSPISDRTTACPAAGDVDLRGRVVMPGMTNGHTHSAMTLLRGYSDDVPLHTWLTHIRAFELRMTADDIAAGLRLALVEMLLSGTTGFIDMFQWDDALLDVVADIRYARQRGARGVRLRRGGVPERRRPARRGGPRRHTPAGRRLRATPADHRVLRAARPVHLPAGADPRRRRPHPRQRARGAHPPVGDPPRGRQRHRRARRVADPAGRRSRAARDPRARRARGAPGGGRHRAARPAERHRFAQSGVQPQARRRASRPRRATATPGSGSRSAPTRSRRTTRWICSRRSRPARSCTAASPRTRPC